MGPNVMVLGGLAGLLADTLAGQFDAATLGLFINDVDPGKTAVGADFTPATFTTSTPVALTWGEAYINSDGNWESSSQLVQFDWDSGDTETVYGITIKSAGGGTPLLLYARLDTPVELGDTNHSISFVVRLTMSEAGFGVSVQIAP